MLNELVEFGKQIRNPNDSDALKQEAVSIVVTIGEDGRFISIDSIEKKFVKAEVVIRTSGLKARLIVDTLEYALGFIDPEKVKKEKTHGKTEKNVQSKHKLYLERLEEIKDIKAAAPLRKFFFDNKELGMNQLSQVEIRERIKKQDRGGNVTFLVLGEPEFVNEHADILRYLSENKCKEDVGAKYQLCAICGQTDFPVANVLHLPVRNVPPVKDDQNGGKRFISYRYNSFESYGLTGNENSSICSACARNYVEGLNHLLGNGISLQTEKGKAYWHYSNRKNLASDTAMIYWTKKHTPTPEVDLLENARERETDIFTLIRNAPGVSTSARTDDLALLLDSPYTGQRNSLESVDADRFYSCILSGAAARIAVRSWLESTTPLIKKHIAEWFIDIAVMEWDYDRKVMAPRFFSLRELSAACGTHRKKEQSGSARYELDKEDGFIGRAAALMWHCALLGKTPPLTLLDRVLRRVRTEEGRVTAARTALLKLILNRSGQFQTTGARRMQTKLDQENVSTAYVAGRIFAMLESIQTAALGKKLNAPIRDRFFSFASTSPAPAFGRLLKLSQNHLSKLRGENPGLAVFLEKKLSELFRPIAQFPLIFTLEEQGQFAIGYYHQRHDNFAETSSANASDAENDDQGE